VIILTFRTDKPISELALFNDDKKVGEILWEADRTLADAIHIKIKELLQKNSCTLTGIGGIVCFEGPGSFTGLRIGLTVANTFAYSLGCPIVPETGKAWRQKGVKRLLKGENDKIALPKYGAEAHITPPKK